MKLKKVVYLFSIIIISICLNATKCYSEKLKDIDSETIKVGVKNDLDFTTIRLQSFSGNWTTILYPKVASGSKATPQPSKELIQEGEDICISLNEKGITARLSEGTTLSAGYDRVVFRGGDLLSAEIPNNPPILFVGKVEIIADPPSLSITNTLTLKQMITSTVSEIMPSSEPEAIKALVVMVRTRLMYLKQTKPHKDEGFDICDKEHCLQFNGAGRNRELVSLLIPIVKNQYLTYKGKVIFPRFQTCCGGKISSAKEVYGLDEPYHKSLIDRLEKGHENCFHSPWFNWTIELTKKSILDFLSIEFAGGADRIYLAWQPSAVDENGRITKVVLRGRRPKEIPGYLFLDKIKEYIGSNSIKSMKFNMDILNRSIIFKGMGKGKGVGMCLYGADGLAKKGKNYKEILKFYYPGTTINK